MVRTVRYFYDLGHSYPLWESGTDQYSTSPQDYRLSDDLAERLRVLAREYAVMFDRIDASTRAGQVWREQPWAADWVARDRQALADLTRELAGVAEISDEVS